MNDLTPNTAAPGPKGFLRANLRRLLLGAAFAATFVAGGFVMSGAPALAMDMAMGEHGGMHSMAMAHAHIDRMLTQVDATPEQKAKIETIFKTAFQTLKPLHEKLADTHRDLHQLLTAPTIDHAALEQLRASRMADMDQASKVLVQAMADSADVLNPEQRAKLGTLMAQHHHHA